MSLIPIPKEYKIIEHLAGDIWSAAAFTEEIEGNLKNDWRLYGDLVVTRLRKNNNFFYSYHQVMIRY